MKTYGKSSTQIGTKKITMIGATISNAIIVAASLLYGEKDYGKTVCLSVSEGFDTDCNAATAGSILGVALGGSNIPEYWGGRVNDTLCASIFTVQIILWLQAKL